ncbi:hypothetical protein ACSBL2_20695 [Pedobacter sp. AW31-3R]
MGNTGLIDGKLCAQILRIKQPFTGMSFLIPALKSTQEIPVLTT